MNRSRGVRNSNRTTAVPANRPGAIAPTFIPPRVEKDPLRILENRFSVLKPVATRRTRFQGGTVLEEILLPDSGDQWISAVEAELLLPAAKEAAEQQMLLNRRAKRLDGDDVNLPLCQQSADNMRKLRMTNAQWSNFRASN